MKAGRLFFRLQWIYSSDHLPSSASSVRSGGCSALVSLLFSVTGNTGRESYYHGFFNSLAASPGSIITSMVGSSLPFILFSFLLPPELPTKRCGRTQREGSGVSQLYCVPGGLPQERSLVNPFAGGEPHTQRGK